MKRPTTSFPVRVVVEYDANDPSDHKWSAYCPTLPSCFSEGRTREEAIANVREVIAACHDLVAEELTDKDVAVVLVPA